LIAFIQKNDGGGLPFQPALDACRFALDQKRQGQADKHACQADAKCDFEARQRVGITDPTCPVDDVAGQRLEGRNAQKRSRVENTGG
jgi:hypothetical protein